MKKLAFYKLTNTLYEMSYNNYLNHLKKNIFSKNWFKKACKEKKIRVKYLSRNILKNDSKKNYLLSEEGIAYFSKFFVLKFYYEPLEDENHLKLLNINIRNETLIKTITLLFSMQKEFLRTNYYQDMLVLDRKTFILEYIKEYDSYLDASVLSKILNNITYISEDKIFKLNHLIPTKGFLYSLYIKDIINDDTDKGTIQGDKDIADLLYKKYNIKLSRRTTCSIRNKYLIPKTYKRKDFNFNFFLLNDNYYESKKILNKKNLQYLKNNTQGVYELSSNKIEKYPFSSNNVIYIGSSQNIKKRLLTYTSQTAHTNTIKNFFKENEEIYFRIIRTTDYQNFEMLLLNSFIHVNGELPKLNKQRVLSLNNHNCE
ncbi:MAG: GIY-YIG nuclease family protein [Candidatus Marinarcus sp.]|uniref:GIY-YIG nuclease family protein n=1 Tax=Candidatus Marinarcus sp. TaxID=3100987 RepID=UPI003B00BD0C